MEGFGSMLGMVGIVGGILVLVIVAAILIRRYQIAKPNEAIIVTGGKGKEVVDEEGKTTRDLSSQRVVTGGGVFVMPFVQKSFKLSLESRKMDLNTEAQSKDGITIAAKAVAVVKVGGSSEMIRAAAQRFLGNEDQIKGSTEEVLSGSLRALIGTLTVEQIMNDRAAVAQKVLEAAEEALTKQGLVIDTLQIKDVRDDQDYIANRGRPEAARVRQLAEISETRANQAAQEERIAADRVILDKDRDLQLRRAEITKETDRAQAVAAAARPLEEAMQQQAIVDQEQITAQKRVALKEQQLNSDVRAVADAEAYQAEKEASAQARANVLRAQSEKDARIAQAEADKEVGLAQAAAIEAVGAAEAKATKARGDALAEQAQQVLAQELIKVFPEIVKNYASALGGIGNMTVVSADGASAVAGQTIGGIKGVLEMAHETLGVDLTSIVNGAVTGSAAGSAAARAKLNPSRPRDHEENTEGHSESRSDLSEFPAAFGSEARGVLDDVERRVRDAQND